jgi:hypothetical protein
VFGKITSWEGHSFCPSPNIVRVIKTEDERGGADHKCERNFASKTGRRQPGRSRRRRKDIRMDLRQIWLCSVD